jgi:hypothetical protein
MRSAQITFCFVSFAIVAIFALSSCSPSAEAMKPNMAPCHDSLMLALNARPLDSLTTRQYQYLSDMRHLCEERQEELRAFKIADAASDYYSTWSTIIIITSIVGIVIAVLPQHK